MKRNYLVMLLLFLFIGFTSKTEAQHNFLIKKSVQQLPAVGKTNTKETIAGPTIYSQMEDPNTTWMLTSMVAPELEGETCYAADDFTVPAGETWTIGSIKVHSIGSNYEAIEGFTVGFFADNSGVPGNEIASFVIDDYELETWSDGSFTFAEVAMHFQDAQVFSGGSYWISIAANGGAEMVYWSNIFQNTDDAAGSSWYWKNPENGYGSGFVNWTHGEIVADGFNMVYYPNLCYSLHAPQLTDDLKLTAFVSPESDGGLSAKEDVTISIDNFGTETQSGFEVAFKINESDWVTELVSEEISAGENLSYTFHDKVNLASIEAYTIQAKVILDSDEDLTNNELSTTVYNYGEIYVAASNQDLNICDGSFTDPGGLGEPINAAVTNYTIYPASDNSMVSVIFPEFDLGTDIMYVYNGANEQAELLGAYTGADLLNKTLYGYNSGGCLTFSTEYGAWEPTAGWVGFVQCVEPTINDFAVINVNSTDFNLFTDTKIILTATVRNNGIRNQSKTVTFTANGQEIGTVDSDELGLGQTQELTWVWETPISEQLTISASVEADEGIEDNNVAQIDKMVYPKGKLVESFESNIFPPVLWEQKVYGGFVQGDMDILVAPFDGEHAAAVPRNTYKVDTLITPLLAIEEGDILSFNAFTEIQVFGGLEIIYSVSKNGPWKSLYNCETALLENQWSFEIDLSSCVGNHYLGFVGDDYIVLDKIIGPQLYLYENDLNVLTFTGTDKPALNSETIYTAEIMNMGSSELSGQDYSVDVKIQFEDNKETFFSVSGVDLASLETMEIEIPVSFDQMGVGTLYAEINYSNDENSENNMSEHIDVLVMKEGTENVGVGSGNDSEYLFPFSPGYTSNAGEVLFKADEIAISGELHGISLSYTSLNELSNTLEVYVVETEEDELQSYFSSAENFYKVFDDVIDIKVGNNNTLYLPFDEPYLYGGKNIKFIFYWPYMEEYVYCELLWNTTTTPDARTNSISSNFANTDINIFDQDYLYAQYTNHVNTIPNTVFHIKTTERDAILNGTITHESNQPMEGVTVSIEGYVNTATSDAEGKYEMLSMPYGDLSLRASIFGYYDLEKTASFGQVSETTVDFQMEKLPNVAIKGIVLSNDYQTPLANANVIVSGYESYNTTTNQDGSFIVHDIYTMQDYMLTIKHPQMDDYMQNISVAIDTVDIGNISMDETETAAYNFVASLEDEAVNLSWQAPYTSQSFSIVPPDTVNLGSDNYVANEAYEDIQVGNLFELNDTATLKSLVIRVVGYTQLEENGAVSIKIYNHERVLVAETDTFTMPNEPMWLEVNVPNITFTDDFYGMIHWNKLPYQTPFIGFNYSENDVAYAMQNNDGEFVKLSELLAGFNGALRLYANLEKGEAKAHKSIESYSIYRKPAGLAHMSEEWDLLAENVETQNYMDTDYAGLDSNYYVYRLHTNYTNDEAPIVYSTLISKGVYAALNFNVTANTGQSTENALITLTNIASNDIHNYSVRAGANGKASLPMVYKRIYNLVVTLDGFAPYTLELNVLGDKNFNIELQENIYDPGNLTALVDNDAETVTLTWGIGESEAFVLDDGQVDAGYTLDTGDGYLGNKFETDSKGFITSIDLYGISHDELSYDQTAEVTLEIFDMALNQLYVSEAFKLPADDWITINLDNVSYDGSFYAFVHMNNGTTNYLAVDASGNEGHFYEEGVGLFTLEEAGVDPGVFMIRSNVLVNGTASTKKTPPVLRNKYSKPDIASIEVQKTVHRIEKSNATYSIFLNDLSTSVADNLSDRSYVFENLELENGTHTAGVQAVYQSGVSAMATIDFTIAFVNLSDQENHVLQLYPNPAKQYVRFQGIEKAAVFIYDQNSKLMWHNELVSEHQMIDISSLESGLYVIKVYQEDRALIRKLQIIK